MNERKYTLRKNGLVSNTLNSLHSSWHKLNNYKSKSNNNTLSYSKNECLKFIKNLIQRKYCLCIYIKNNI